MTLKDFKNNFNGGTRLNRFFVEGRIPFANKDMSQFHVRATQFPALTSTSLSYDYRGRKFYYPGEKTYTTWSISILDDVEAGDMWKAFQTWQNNLNNHETNQVNNSVLNHQHNNFKSTWSVNHLNLNGTGTPLKKFTLYGCWPKIVNPINFNMNRPNTPNVFDVILIYDYINIMNVT